MSNSRFGFRTRSGSIRSIIESESSGLLLLDLYPNATMAYSLRKLRTLYAGNAIRVRRSNDNTEQDIGFDANGDLDTAALTTFCSGTNGFVTIWYDQSTGSFDATQTTAINQPQIVSSGSVLTTNGKPTISVDGSNDSLGFSNVNFAASNYNSFVGKRAVSARHMFAFAGYQYFFGFVPDDKIYLQARTSGYNLSNAPDATTSQILLTGQVSSNVATMYKNGTLVASSFISFSLSSGINSIGNYANGFRFTYSEIQEAVYYNSDESGNRTGIENNIKTYFGIP